LFLVTPVIRVISGTRSYTFAYDADGNQVSVSGSPLGSQVSVSMVYDKENRLIVHHDLVSGDRVTYTYSGDGLKRSEITSSGRTTLVWDGSEYLQGRD
jgi:YD repeat-containing protein